MSTKPQKCPYCGELSLYPMQTINGQSFVLTTADYTYGAPIYNTLGLKVTLMGCTNCKGIHIICPSLISTK